MNMRKEEIIEHHKNSNGFVKSLSILNEEQWRTKVGVDKWTVAEVIGHLIPWDEFVLHKRLPYLFSEKEFPKGPDLETTNRKAANIASRQEKQVTIDRFVSVRTQLLEKIDELPLSLWGKEFVIGETSLTLYEYLIGISAEVARIPREVAHTSTKVFSLQ